MSQAYKKQTSASPINLIPHNAWAYYYDPKDNVVYRQKICGMCTVNIAYEEASGTVTGKTMSYETELRYVMAYEDGSIDFDIDLTKQSDFLVYSEDSPAWSVIDTAVAQWREKNKIEGPMTVPYLKGFNTGA